MYSVKYFPSHQFEARGEHINILYAWRFILIIYRFIPFISNIYFFLFKRINWKLYYWKHFNFFVKDSFFVSFLKKKHVPVFVELTVILKIVIPIKQSVYLFTKHEIQLQIICGLFITLITRCQTLRFWWPLKIPLKSV